ncbi:hypothetical protein [Burkholderia ubonensis]|uniref:hypothetical protein n=1 Tax=Burkholderia ubonensis TaxID=101571 RepID=UPI0012FC64A8|nr:hypothetical protein [Burkholderia ubonensis]
MTRADIIAGSRAFKGGENAHRAVYQYTSNAVEWIDPLAFGAAFSEKLTVAIGKQQGWAQKQYDEALR